MWVGFLCIPRGRPRQVHNVGRRTPVAGEFWNVSMGAALWTQDGSTTTTSMVLLLVQVAGGVGRGCCGKVARLGQTPRLFGTIVFGHGAVPGAV